jgi:uncharacterized protein YegP (UPF0339 family)
MGANKNTCRCPDPPGGQASCEGHQLAICRIIGGMAHTDCISPPTDVILASISALEAPPPVALLAGQRISNWTLANLYDKKRQALASLTAQDIEALEAGLEGDAIRGIGAGLRLAPQTVPAITTVIRAATEERDNWAHHGWSADRYAEATLTELYPGVDWPGLYDPKVRDDRSQAHRSLTFEIRQSGQYSWKWRMTDENNREIAASTKTYETREACEAEIARIFATAPYRISFDLQDEDRGELTLYS